MFNSKITDLEILYDGIADKAKGRISYHLIQNESEWIQ